VTNVAPVSSSIVSNSSDKSVLFSVTPIKSMIGGETVVPKYLAGSSYTLTITNVESYVTTACVFNTNTVLTTYTYTSKGDTFVFVTTSTTVETIPVSTKTITNLVTQTTTYCPASNEMVFSSEFFQILTKSLNPTTITTNAYSAQKDISSSNTSTFAHLTTGGTNTFEYFNASPKLTVDFNLTIIFTILFTTFLM
jgi:hypothetical protein